MCQELLCFLLVIYSIPLLAEECRIGIDPNMTHFQMVQDANCKSPKKFWVVPQGQTAGLHHSYLSSKCVDHKQVIDIYSGQIERNNIVYNYISAYSSEFQDASVFSTEKITVSSCDPKNTFYVDLEDKVIELNGNVKENTDIRIYLKENLQKPVAYVSLVDRIQRDYMVLSDMDRNRIAVASLTKLNAGQNCQLSSWDVEIMKTELSKSISLPAVMAYLIALKESQTEDCVQTPPKQSLSGYHVGLFVTLAALGASVGVNVFQAFRHRYILKKAFSKDSTEMEPLTKKNN